MTNIGVEHCASFISSQFQSAGGGADAGIPRAVTISRQAGCGALAVAEKLAHYLKEHSAKTDAAKLIGDAMLNPR